MEKLATNWILPVDSVVSAEFSNDVPRTVPSTEIPDDEEVVLDIVKRNN